MCWAPLASGNKCVWHFHVDTEVNTFNQTLIPSLDKLLLSEEYSQGHLLMLRLSQHLCLNDN